MEQQEYKGYTIKVEQEDDPENPRYWDNAGTMVCWHRSLNLGDEQPNMDPRTWLQGQLGMDVLDYESRRYRWMDAASVDELLLEFKKTNIVLPLFLLDHTNLSIRTSEFSDKWDSGQVGWIYISHEDAVKEWGKKRFTKDVRRRATDYLIGEVNTYDQYLSGDVYGYIIEDRDGGHIDSCWGFYGESYCLKEAKEMADILLRNATQKQWEAMINVPVMAE